MTLVNKLSKNLAYLFPLDHKGFCNAFCNSIFNNVYMSMDHCEYSLGVIQRNSQVGREQTDISDDVKPLQTQAEILFLPIPFFWSIN